MVRSIPGAALSVLVCAAPLPDDAHAQLLTPSFTTAQATSGKAVYDDKCASCHGARLSDGQFGPPLKGAAFRQRWGSTGLDALFSAVAAMPVGAPRSLGDPTYADLLAYVLQQNGVNAGAQALPHDPTKLAGVMLPMLGPHPSGGVSASIALPAPPEARPNTLEHVNPVTDEMLAAVPAADWLTWRRANDAMGFSPLKQIDKDSVSRLRIAWSWTLPEGPNQVTPLVHDGIMFVHGFRDVIQALDAASGDLLWEYRRWLPPGLDALQLGKRSIAIYGQNLYVPTSDAHVVALDVRTGKVVWDKVVGDLGQDRMLTSGPLVAQGMVMIGTSGEGQGGNFIVGMDAQTGEVAWRVHTIAHPGQLGDESWNGVPLQQRKGASAWIPGTYDPELGLAFFGTAQPYDATLLTARKGQREVALFTDSTLALEPRTGKLKWHYQHLPNDRWEMDWVFERHLLRLKIGGSDRKVVMAGGKAGVFDLLAADSGRYLSSFDLGLQNFIVGIDAKTGAKQIDTSLIPTREHTITVCPHVDGAKNWLPSAINPESHTLFVPLMEVCMDLIPTEPGEDSPLSAGVRWAARPRPDSDGKYGQIAAVSIESGEVIWRIRQRAPRTSGLLATAGGVVFSGDLDRYFGAYDQLTGKELWRVRLNDVPSSAPITFAANGKQYVAVTVGHALLAVARRSMVPEIRLPTAPGATVWVFEISRDK